MILKENNFAYIDAANLHNGILGFGWKLDYARLKKAPDADETAQGSFS